MDESLQRYKYYAIATGVAIALGIIIPIGLLYSSPQRRNFEPIEIRVDGGEGLNIISSKLKNANLINSELVFIGYIKIRGAEDNLKAGRYIFSKSMNISTIASRIINGQSESEDVEVTIPEGFNIWEVDKRFFESGLIVLGDISDDYLHKEGYLFPDTYRFNKETLVQDIINTMEVNYYAKGVTRGDEVVIIASLLEKEAKTKEDMELVAGIIYRRLKLGMLLQVDASVAYGWCLKQASLPGYRGFCDVTQAPVASEIGIDGPYNTYIRPGLPQGAISNPGLIALQAAQNSRSSDYLYYLSTRDGSQIIYSKTAGEHVANRRKYLGL